MPIIVTESTPVVSTAAAWEFDPLSEDAANVNLPLAMPDYGVLEFNAPMPAPDVLYASSVDTEGENPASTRFRNRTVTLRVDVWGRAALSALEFKVAKLIREKGTLLYTLPGGEEIVFDVLGVDTFEFPHGIEWDTRELATVTLALTCRPFGRGPEVDLGDNVETSLPWLIWTEADIPGTWTALGRLEIDNDVATAQAWAIWGIRSRHYSSDASAALGWQAESCTVTSGAVATGPAGASGGASNNTVRNQSLTTGVWDPTIILGTGSSPRTSHVGSYRVFTRVQAPTSNTGTTSVRLEWGSGLGTNENAAVSVDPSYEGTWRILDLGQIDIPERLVGANGWDGVIAATTTAATGDLYFDWIMLVPIDESSGEATTVSSINVAQASATLSVRWDGVITQAASGGTSWYPSPQFRGDYLRIPPSGDEGRVAEIIVKMSRGEPLAGADSAIDDLSARMYVMPRYLVVPDA
jgi:hypothetical protein